MAVAKYATVTILTLKIKTNEKEYKNHLQN